MKKLNETLSEVLDLEPIETTATEVVPVTNTVVNDDADFARQNIRELIEKGNLAVDGILNVAKESEHPRAYEVAANLIKNLSDLNKDLMEIQKRKKDLDPQAAKRSCDVNVDKAVFVGSTTELVKFLKNNK
jgi:ABC-type proline/glycine betaine transport system substrate-binding protein